MKENFMTVNGKNVKILDFLTHIVQRFGGWKIEEGPIDYRLKTAEEIREEMK